MVEHTRYILSVCAPGFLIQTHTNLVGRNRLQEKSVCDDKRMHRCMTGESKYIQPYFNWTNTGRRPGAFDCSRSSSSSQRGGKYEPSHKLWLSRLGIYAIWMSSLPASYNTLILPNSFLAQAEHECKCYGYASLMSWEWHYCLTSVQFYPSLFKVPHFKRNYKSSVNLNKACHLTSFIGGIVFSLFLYRSPETGKKGIITHVKWV